MKLFREKISLNCVEVCELVCEIIDAMSIDRGVDSLENNQRCSESGSNQKLPFYWYMMTAYNICIMSDPL